MVHLLCRWNCRQLYHYLLYEQLLTMTTSMAGGDGTRQLYWNWNCAWAWKIIIGQCTTNQWKEERNFQPKWKNNQWANIAINETRDVLGRLCYFSFLNAAIVPGGSFTRDLYPSNLCSLTRYNWVRDLRTFKSVRIYIQQFSADWPAGQACIQLTRM